jgi:hypothetical protein
MHWMDDVAYFDFASSYACKMFMASSPRLNVVKYLRS